MEQIIRCSDFRHSIVPLKDEVLHSSTRILDAQFPNFIFGTKAETLCNLAARIKTATIPELLYFTVGEWQKDKKAICQEIQSYFGSGKIVVRSSSLGEDSEETAMAGMHTSLIDIDPSNTSQLKQAIACVASSYEKHNTTTDTANNQILVQKMVSNVSMSGVVFTQEMSTGAPYFVINYDDQTGRTDTVTSGDEYSNRTLFVHRDAVQELNSERFKALLNVVREIELATHHEYLDIEFAVDKNLHVYLFQCRKITTRPNWNRGLTLKINDAIRRIQTFVAHAQHPQPGIYGNRSLFGQMPDWNPAEMIGTAPRPLAQSLYRYLITDSSWRIARNQMGYAEPVGTPLMVSLAGQPFIDARLSFHSYLPADLEPEISNKLVNAWLDRLAEHRELHDKVEFEVAITGLFLDFKMSVEEQFPQTLLPKEYETFQNSLRTLTNALMTHKKAPIDGELNKIQHLSQRRRQIESAPSEPHVIRALLEDCIQYGTIPFSILARHGFIAKSFLRSMLRTDLLTEAEAQAFENDIHTVASDLVLDSHKLSLGEISTETFFAQYGHLRPGTYDILSLRYDQREDLITNRKNPVVPQTAPQDFVLSAKRKQNIQKHLDALGLDIETDALFEYMRKAIAAREYAKFVFSRNISDALEHIAKWGEKQGLSREEISYLTIQDVFDVAITAQGRTLEQHLRDLSRTREEEHLITMHLRLPYLIVTPQDVAIVPQVINRPNFITRKAVQAPVIWLDGHETQVPNITDKIVLIPSADPGFDWIFSYPIKGLVTKFGGSNSHMAIRCAEFGLPAAIGCGEQIFEKIKQHPLLELNCGEERILPLGH